MAGHSHFANIKHKKDAQDKKKSKILTRVQRNIMVALKTGLPDPDVNSKLRSAILEAKSANLPKDKIDAAIKRYSNNSDSDDNYEEMRYNGYAPGGIAIIIECLTDNKNRTAGEVRAIFSKYGGNLGETGSVEYSFAHIGLIVYQKNAKTIDEIIEIAIEAEAIDVQEDDQKFYITTDWTKVHEIAEKVSNKLGDAESISVIWDAENKIAVSGEQKEKLLKMLDAFENLDDVQDVFSNANFD
ncbi:YebC/PmpR family DNA-binding transcriptional regulator [Candidatus Deianiraea vastatrix]|uniref:Probable transcriptional regulatory protein Deia_01116 n=1 Tax=Candidatus Deianiraea vastatrix TaxID=2163644 RepID=A0A5B8XKC7_9RICK|nr:YebC/PmpR family DNA-binding transcriptional regulator [Candidatus Deianiraea vastatrix]QED23897.1 Putative transcriptional regulatory protein [Candidatus Deianiraea vastatrix]